MATFVPRLSGENPSCVRPMKHIRFGHGTAITWLWRKRHMRGDAYEIGTSGIEGYCVEHRFYSAKQPHSVDRRNLRSDVAHVSYFFMSVTDPVSIDTLLIFHSE